MQTEAAMAAAINPAPVPWKKAPLRNSKPASHLYCIVAAADPYAQDKANQIVAARFALQGFWLAFGFRSRRNRPPIFLPSSLKEPDLKMIFLMPMTLTTVANS
jgi:hypothetical protein